VVLSDKSIREELDSGGIVIEPLGDGALQPSSVDLRVDRYFRVFRNDTTPFIDPKQPQEDLTELVEVDDDGSFILHPGEFVLGSTLERVALGDDLVARLEGKSSLGRLGLLIHSSLPESEPVMVLADGRLEPRPIGEVVKQRLRGSVVSFDPVSFEVGYHEITGWYEGPPDRIYEVSLASGRRVRVTAGHNLFTLDEHGRLAKTRTGELRPGARVAIPGAVPDPPRLAGRIASSERIHLVPLIPETERPRFTCTGPAVAAEFERDGARLSALLREAGFAHHDYYRSRSRLPLPVAASVPGLLAGMGTADRIGARGSRHSLPSSITVDAELAWLLGMYVAEGSRRKNQFTVSNTDQTLLDRVESAVDGLGIPAYRGSGVITGCSGLFSSLLGWLGTGQGSHTKRIPPLVFGWSRPLLESFLEGLVDGDGSRKATRTSYWTCSDGLAADVLLLAERLGLRAGSSVRDRGGSRLWQVYMPTREHKLLTSVPLPDRLLVELRTGSGLDQAAASRLAGYTRATDLCNIENRTGRDAVRVATLRRLRAVYSRRPECPPSLRRLDRLVDGGLLWDRVVEVRDTGAVEPIYDLEVRPGGRKVENFLAGAGGVFVSNTAGFVDAGWDGHLTLELSNVANLPIAIYPGMKIGQISFLRMTTPAEKAYGSEATRSKYQGQQGPTPSRYYLNFADEERDSSDSAGD
jgi:deoxycytidine triphosphate deaminase/intein/homing endonuclease